MKETRGKAWLKQAKNDFLFAKAALQAGFFAQTCFICQQCSEKALKAILYHRGASAVITHSLMKLCEVLSVNHKLLAASKVLDRYYLTARYPDALPDGAPFETFSKNEAEEAVRFAQLFIQKAGKLVK